MARPVSCGPLALCSSGLINEESAELNIDGSPRREVFRLEVLRALHVPTWQACVGVHILVEVIDPNAAKAVARAQSREVKPGHPGSDEASPGFGGLIIALPRPSLWDFHSAVLQVQIIARFIGGITKSLCQCSIPLQDLLRHPTTRLFMQDANGDSVVSSAVPRGACEIEVAPEASSMPSHWPEPVPREAVGADKYPCHAFLMTRGTRGDVQPFLALGCGLAAQRGWLVTICTELRYKDLVKQYGSKVSRGKVRFRPCGGDTERQLESRLSQWVVNSNSELMQMVVLSASESNFFISAPAFAQQMRHIEKEGMPVSVIIAGLTVLGTALMLSEAFSKPLINFNLQPYTIPSQDKHWKAVHVIETGRRSLVSRFEKRAFTGQAGQDTLEAVKRLMDDNPFDAYRLGALRKEYGLPSANAWDALRSGQVPVIIPLRPGSFARPWDWSDRIKQTDFIFLRDQGDEVGEDQPSGLEPVVCNFIDEAKAAGAPVVLMTFSSMPVLRETALACAVKILKASQFQPRLIYVGRQRKGDTVEDATLLAEVDSLERQRRLLQMESADFGSLFTAIDAFIVHGGLGTTVEALRRQKPVQVTGPLLLDQRFWGEVVEKSGVGPAAVHIDFFLDRCVSFVDNALDPQDPKRWRATAQRLDWGDYDEDGVRCNVDCVVDLLFKTLHGH